VSLENVSATRINLIQTKKTLNLAESGRTILERKRDILLRELRQSIYEAERAREDLNEVLVKAYASLVEANVAAGSEAVSTAALGSSLAADFLLDYRSIMGVTIPVVKFMGETGVKPDYGFGGTNVKLDEAFRLFRGVLERLADLARAEGTVFQMANDVRRTQRRVNALNHVLIPAYRSTVRSIELVLEEKEREEFVRTKRIKSLIREREAR
jgi:V/A-type H+/Na+-transporting ATPase subunit D